MSTSPSPRLRPACAYDPNAKCGFLFGGLDINGVQDDVWKWEDGAWTGPIEVSPTRPAARQFAQAVYSSGDRAILYYGGFRNVPGEVTQEILNDIWLWTGEWHPTAPTGETPPKRYNQSIAYDAGRSRLVLFGGIDPNAFTPWDQDTWEWDGVKWTKFSPPTPSAAPGPRRNAAMAYDAARGKILLCGGEHFSDFDFKNDTWEWDGTQWEKKSPNNVPECSNANMVYDPDRKTIVMFDSGTSWEWDGADWTKDDSTRWKPRDCGALYDIERKRVVTFGGREVNAVPNASNRPSPTWERVGGVWIIPPLPVETSPRYLQQTTVDRKRGVTVVLSADGVGSAEPNALWEHDGTAWTGPLSLPEGFRGISPGFAHDPVHDELVLVGGKVMIIPTQFVFDNSVWIRGSNGWSGPVQDANGPSPRGFQVLQEMDHLSKLVLVGGLTGGHQATHFVDDTWVWTGSAWSKLDLAPTPSSLRFPCASAYDIARKKLVLCDGNATWELDGTQWKLREVAHPIKDVLTPSMAYDPLRQRTVMVGLQSSTIPVPADAKSHGVAGQAALGHLTWEWDGIDWHLKRDTNGDPVTTPDMGHWNLAFSSSRQKVVYFGRDRNGWAHEENWDWDGASWRKF